MSHGYNPQNQQPVIQPVLAELFRTCIHPPILLLRVEHIVQNQIREKLDRSYASLEQEHDPLSGHATRFYLTDGKLLVQALLHRKLNNLAESYDVIPGDLVEIYKFDVKKARRNNKEGHVVYLGINDCRFIAGATRVSRAPATTVHTEAHDSKTATKRKDYPTESLDIHDEDFMAGGFVKENGPEDEQPRMKKRKTEQNLAPSTNLDTPKPKRTNLLSANSGKLYPETKCMETRQQLTSSESTQVPHKTWTSLESSGAGLPPESTSGDEDVFETILPDENTVKKRRRALHELSQTITSSPDYRSIPKVASLSRASSSKSTIVDTVGTHEVHDIDNRPRLLTKELSASTPSTRPASTHHLAITQDKQDPKFVASEPPFRNLYSILHPTASAPLPRKNYVFTTLAMITYVGPSLITKPNTPFPPKRHIKIEDPSLHVAHKDQTSSSCYIAGTTDYTVQASSSFPDKRGKGITVAIYQDASNFKPSFGTLALFRGLVMQRLSSGDVVLNIYPRKAGYQARLDERNQHDRGSEVNVTRDNHNHYDGQKSLDEDCGFHDGEWFITDQTRLQRMGYDVVSISTWWNERVRELKLAR